MFHIITYPYGKHSGKNLTVEVIYRADTRPSCVLFHPDGTPNIPAQGSMITLPLESGFTFSGKVIETPLQEGENITIRLDKIQIERDGCPHPEIASSDIANILTRYRG
ncbi:MAG: hypothetical protein RLZZ517_467 [Candidatus Parcubacteria bacterium]|jgi:hypothetical protein